LHAELDSGDQLGVFRVDSAIDPPVEISHRPHLTTIVGQRIADLAQQRFRRAHRNELHEIDLVRVNVEGDVGEQLEVKPLALVALRQVIDLRHVALIRPL